MEGSSCSRFGKYRLDYLGTFKTDTSSRLLKKQIYQATPCLSDAFFEVFNMVTALEVCPKALFKLFRHTSPRTYAC